jgi:hypothetical protein
MHFSHLQLLHCSCGIQLGVNELSLLSVLLLLLLLLRLGAADVELGLGIHGEPGAAVMPLPPVRELVATMMAWLVAYKGEEEVVQCTAWW